MLHFRRFMSFESFPDRIESIATKAAAVPNIDVARVIPL